MVSVILTLKNRAHLLKWGFEGLLQLNSHHLINEINIADGGSEDNLDYLLKEYSKYFKINCFNFDRKKSIYNHKFNCPSLEYNFLVSKCSNEHIIKIDPEFVFITPDLLERSIELLKEHPYAFIIPFPYHTYEFPISSIEDIKNKYKNYYYQNHLTEHGVNNGYCRLVYYGGIFLKKYFIELGGIDIKFVEGIGSEDDHFFDQWERKYGLGSVVSTTEEKGVHLWHGEWGKSIPENLNEWVFKNRDLRKILNYTYPNDGDFNSIVYPECKLICYENTLCH